MSTNSRISAGVNSLSWILRQFIEGYVFGSRFARHEFKIAITNNFLNV